MMTLFSDWYSWLTRHVQDDEFQNWLRVGERTLLFLLAANFLWNLKNSESSDQSKKSSLLKRFIQTVSNSQIGKKLLTAEIEKEVKKNVAQMFPKPKGRSTNSQGKVTFPEKGVKESEIEEYLLKLKEMDVKTNEGKAFAFVYHLSEGHDEFVTRMHNMFINTNCLSPMAFKSLRQMEIELVEMTSSLFHGQEACHDENALSDEFHREFLKKDVVGNLTSGGTESLLVMLKTYRDFFSSNIEEFKKIMKKKYPSQSQEIENYNGPFEVIVPTTIHPAVNKGAHYFGLKLVEVDVDPETMAVIPEKVEQAFHPGKTILVIGSCPSYPHGVLDPIEKLSEIVVKLGPIALHVDCCIGGYVMPFIQELNAQKVSKEQLCTFDFLNLGVTSISADLHKYGYSCKGASVIMYRNSFIRKYQFFVYSGWSGGLYISPTVTGSKGGGPIASSYASIKLLGKEGFLKVTAKMLHTRSFIQNAIETDELLSKYLCVVGRPCSTILSFTTHEAFHRFFKLSNPPFTSSSDDINPNSINIFAISDHMEKQYGWDLQRQIKPDSLHMTLMPQHIGLEERIVSDLKQSLKYVIEHGSEFSGKNSVAMYGMVANVESWLSEDTVELFLKTFVDEVYRLRQ
ncbi:hypothetical protein C9374_007983 [Naegleria lovaniensis]|uniref:Sphingosine-1-phosphate lyase n=1 Tax=Naegleria lovaniensis TaxID=51637 RepID=A0AA88KGR2_NAELO|nr:uncharacterized protein C9374_007983 [Naegleria lovaniensis]KAG2378835.1 hypothetical protein C9374_007983 [Naegleria lovaniensis]